MSLLLAVGSVPPPVNIRLPRLILSLADLSQFDEILTTSAFLKRGFGGGERVPRLLTSQSWGYEENFGVYEPGPIILSKGSFVPAAVQVGRIWLLQSTNVEVFVDQNELYLSRFIGPIVGSGGAVAGVFIWKPLFARGRGRLGR